MLSQFLPFYIFGFFIAFDSAVRTCERLYINSLGLLQRVFGQVEGRFISVVYDRSHFISPNELMPLHIFDWSSLVCPA